MARKTVRYTIDKMPAKLRWRPRVSGWGIFFGAIGGLGGVVLIQQAGLRVLTRALSIQGLSGAVISGIIIPSLVYMISVGAYNRRLRHYLKGSAGRAMAATTTVAVLAISTAALLVSSASPAHATVTGPCRVTLNGVDVAPLQPTAADAILVDAEGSLTGTLEFPSEIDGGSIDLMYAGFTSFNFQQWDGLVDNGDAIDSGGGVESRTVRTDVIAKYAAGVYDVFGTVVFENGQACEVAFAFKIDVPPLGTLVGRGAAVAAAFGLLGTFGVIVGRTREGATLLAYLERQLSSLPTPDPLEQELVVTGTRNQERFQSTDALDAGDVPPDSSSPPDPEAVEAQPATLAGHAERGPTPVPDLSFDNSDEGERMGDPDPPEAGA